MTNIVHHLGRRLATGTALLLASLALAGPSVAQAEPADAPWQAWLGCWQPVEAQAQEGTEAAPTSLVCVVPTSEASAVEVVTVTDGTITERDRIAVTGERHASERDGCTGWENLSWSADGRRVYRTSEHQCAGGTQRASSGVLTLLRTGDWISAQGVRVGSETRVRVLRYRPAPEQAAVPAEITRALQGRALAVETARLAAAAPLTEQDVAEATRQIDSAVVEAWLIEQGQGFAMNARKLVQLADAGVPERVIDLMVALSYPNVFAIDAAAREGELRPDEKPERIDPRRRVGPVAVLDPWYSPGYGWGGYYPGYYGYGRYYSGRPAVIVVRQPEPDRPRARAVNGRGYTRGGSSGDAAGSNPMPSAGRGSSGSSGGSAGPASSGSGSSSGSTRKAKPRDGGS